MFRSYPHSDQNPRSAPVCLGLTHTQTRILDLHLYVQVWSPYQNPRSAPVCLGLTPLRILDLCLKFRVWALSTKILDLHLHVQVWTPDQNPGSAQVWAPYQNPGSAPVCSGLAP